MQLMRALIKVVKRLVPSTKTPTSFCREEREGGREGEREGRKRGRERVVNQLPSEQHNGITYCYVNMCIPCKCVPLERTPAVQKESSLINNKFHIVM